MWYDTLTEEDIEILDNMLSDSSLKDNGENIMTYFKHSRKRLREFICTQTYIMSLIIPYEEVPLYINESTIGSFYARWRLRIGK